MPEPVKMILVLTVIAGVAGFGLSVVNSKTEPLIAENERQFTLRSIKLAIPQTDEPDPCGKFEPAFDNAPDEDAVCIGEVKIYRARKGEEVIGLAVEAIGNEAYSGTILVLVGLDLDGRTTGVEVLRHAETPGLGALITECWWRQQLVGKRPADMTWKVRKDGGEVDQLSGATISSRSMLDAVTKSQQLLAEHKAAILQAEPLGDGEVCDAR
ncbi:MAG: RnfABCDGE type electron transport complex subunit G [Deltaproteobacteria bacterium]|nr:RnfABCDGE type electron transport complex subunit G [Deltaproteobacteria bacterium]